MIDTINTINTINITTTRYPATHLYSLNSTFLNSPTVFAMTWKFLDSVKDATSCAPHAHPTETIPADIAAAPSLGESPT